MRNWERADKLLQGAGDTYEALKRDLSENHWNLAVRRAQEVVELVLKGLLAEIGVDYPKVHDVAPVFRKEVTEKNLPVEESLLDELDRISSELARKRAPAFYFEEDYSQNEARRAAQDAEIVLKFGKSFIKKLRGK